MRNMTTKEFCEKFSACSNGTAFALKYETMRDCYQALLDGKAGENSSGWAVWAFTRQGAADIMEQRKFALFCARRVQHLMKDQRSIDALDVTERHLDGKATIEEIKAAIKATAEAAKAAADAAVYAAAYAASVRYNNVCAAELTYAAEREKQLDYLRRVGNIFEASEGGTTEETERTEATDEGTTEGADTSDSSDKTTTEGELKNEVR